MIALLGCLIVAAPFAAMFIGVGVAYERQRHHEAQTVLIPSGVRHARHHHRRTAKPVTHPTRSRHLRVVAPPFDFEEHA